MDNQWAEETRNSIGMTHKEYYGNDSSCNGVMELETGNYVSKQSAYVTVKCDCGEELDCHNFTNTCTCGLDYNSSGQQLAPREQWGEETGEPWYECY